MFAYLSTFEFMIVARTQQTHKVRKTEYEFDGVLSAIATQ